MDKRKDFKDSYFNGFKSLFPELTEDKFLSFYDEAIYGGYPEEAGGSIWESEGKSIYVLIRILKPKRILEIGNFLGKSSNHILQAVEKNGVGDVTLLDIEERIEYNKIHNNNFERVINNSLDYLDDRFYFDLILQDSDHTYKHVFKEIQLILKNNISDIYYIWSHDYYMRHKVPQCEVWKAWDELKNNFNTFLPFKDSVSDCGFSIAKNEL